MPADEIDSDGDGQAECEGDCAEGDDDTFDGAPELCDGLDNDCDSVVPLDEVDNDGDGFDECGDGDCDDTNDDVYDGAPELCEGLDNDCSGLADDGDEIAGNGVDDDCDGDVDEFTFTHIYTNIIQPICTCHGFGSSGGWTFANDQDTLYSVWVDEPANQPSSGMDRVEPGDSTLSYVMHKLDGSHGDAAVGGFGSQMPLSGCCLDQATRDGIRDWIDEGAPDN